MNVVSVTYHETGLRTLSVECEGCSETHQIVWPIGELTLAGELPCGVVLRGVALPDWAFDPRYRTGYKKYPQKPHEVFAGQAASTNEQLDDNAINDPARNWEE